MIKWLIAVERLVPTRVGMILQLRRLSTFADACPHTRGDDPKSDKSFIIIKSLSPHAWG